jgi:hypothetical protein
MNENYHKSYKKMRVISTTEVRELNMYGNPPTKEDYVYGHLMCNGHPNQEDWDSEEKELKTYLLDEPCDPLLVGRIVETESRGFRSDRISKFGVTLKFNKGNYIIEGTPKYPLEEIHIFNVITPVYSWLQEQKQVNLFDAQTH